MNCSPGSTVATMEFAMNVFFSKKEISNDNDNNLNIQLSYMIFLYDIVYLQVEYTVQSHTSSDGEDDDVTQESLEDRKYPGEVTTSSYKVKLPPKDIKKDLLL